MACVLIHANRNVSVTDASCRWVEPSSGPLDDEVKTVDELYGKGVGDASLQVSSSFDEATAFPTLLEDLQNCKGGGAGAMFLLEEDDIVDSAVLLGRPNVEELLGSVECRQAEDLPRILKLRLGVSWDRIQEIADITKNQSKSDSWHTARRCILTGSSFGDILKFMMRERRGPPAPSLMNRLYPRNSLDGIKAIMYGRNNEQRAIRNFELLSGLKVEKTGIWLDESGILGASPDGLVGLNAVVEVKCPYKWRNERNLCKVLNIAKEQKAKDKDKFVIYFENEQWHCNTDHEYYAQIQAQLAFTRRAEWYLVVFIDKDTVIHSIKFC